LNLKFEAGELLELKHQPSFIMYVFPPTNDTCKSGSSSVVLRVLLVLEGLTTEFKIATPVTAPLNPLVPE
jgi:hypothetical protein